MTRPVIRERCFVVKDTRFADEVDCCKAALRDFDRELPSLAGSESDFGDGLRLCAPHKKEFRGQFDRGGDRPPAAQLGGERLAPAPRGGRPGERLAELRRMADQVPTDQPTVASFIRWYFTSRFERSVLLQSTVPVEEYIRRLLALGTPEARREAEEAFPGHPLLTLPAPAAAGPTGGN